MQKYKALNLKQSPNLRLALADAQRNSTVLHGVAIGIPSVEVAKVVAATSADWVWIDGEHSPYSPMLLVEMIQTIKMYSEGRIIPVVRVPNHSHEWISWALDAGAGGIMIPHTETVEQVRASINAARFGPQGHRSFPPFALISGIQDGAPEGQTWLEVANDHVAVIPLIESRRGIENLEEIMQIEGVDAIMIGTCDLTMDLGGSEALAEEAMERIFELAQKYNMPLVGKVPEPNAAARFRRGYRMIMSADDIFSMVSGIQDKLKTSREMIEEERGKMHQKNAEDKENCVTKFKDLSRL